MRKLLVMLALFLPTLALAGEQVFFATDKSELTPVEKAKIADVAKAVKENEAKVVIIGNADMRGSRLYNLDLGMRRAAAVVEAFVAEGVAEDQLSISLSYGEEKPLAPADKNVHHLAANRRVDIVLVEAKVALVPVPVEVVKEVNTYRKNRITLLGGAGRSALDKDTLGTNHYKVSEDFEAVGGVGYARMLNSRFSIGFNAFTNNSYFVSVGLDF